MDERPTLLANAISLGGDWVASVANVAPTSTVAFTLALLVSFAGLASPLAVVVAGVAMLMVAVGYARLNNWKPHAGAPYIWVGEAVAPILGYATGILAILAATVANIGNITLAGTYLLGIISPGASSANPLVWVISSAIMALVIYIAIRGIRPSIRVQTGIIAFEYTVVIAGRVFHRNVADRDDRSAQRFRNLRLPLCGMGGPSRPGRRVQRCALQPRARCHPRHPVLDLLVHIPDHRFSRCRISEGHRRPRH
jgi:hypothetical protein